MNEPKSVVDMSTEELRAEAARIKAIPIPSLTRDEARHLAAILRDIADEEQRRGEVYERELVRRREHLRSVPRG